MNKNKFHEFVKKRGLAKYNIVDSETVSEVTNAIGYISETLHPTCLTTIWMEHL